MAAMACAPYTACGGRYVLTGDMAGWGRREGAALA